MAQGTGVSRRRPTYETHYEQAKRDLEALALRLAAGGRSRLPPEDQLADEIGFSRPTVRSALLALQMEGKVLRRHGVGTFINHHALGIRANLAEDLPFLEVIERLGFESSLEIVRLAEEPFTDRVQERIGSSGASTGVVIDRLFRASARPAVLSRDYVPTAILTAPMADLTAEHSTFAFIRRWTQRVVRYSVTSIRSLAVDDHVARALGLAPGTPVLMLDHQHIDDHESVVGVTEAFVNDDLIPFSVVRSGTEL